MKTMTTMKKYAVCLASIDLMAMIAIPGTIDGHDLFG